MVLTEPASSGVSGEPATLDPTALFLISESSSLSSFGESDSSFVSELLSFESELESSSSFVELSDPPGFISEDASAFLSLDFFESPFLSLDLPSYISFGVPSSFLSFDLIASPFFTVDLPDSPVFPDLEAESSSDDFLETESTPDDFLETESTPDVFLESAASLAPLDDDAAAASLPASFLSLDESPPADDFLESCASLATFSAGFYLIISPPPSPPSGSSIFLAWFLSSPSLVFDESFTELGAVTAEVVTFDSFLTFVVSDTTGFATFFIVASSPCAKLKL